LDNPQRGSYYYKRARFLPLWVCWDGKTKMVLDNEVSGSSETVLACCVCLWPLFCLFVWCWGLNPGCALPVCYSSRLTFRFYLEVEGSQDYLLRNRAWEKCRYQ
jgi:hypothetical protein